MTENAHHGPFTIRVYGILTNSRDQVLLTRENISGTIITKFPGGGLEAGEGIADCLQREFWEETGLTLESWQFFYVNENYVPSAFHQNTQVISFYYEVKTTSETAVGAPASPDALPKPGELQLYWCARELLDLQPIELPIDRQVVKLLTLL